MNDILDDALIFATQVHHGQVRKMSGIPYILHPCEVAAIIATMTNDCQTIAAGLLHDTIEDCHIDGDLIRERFGARVYALVQSETEDKMSLQPAAQTWQERKEDSLLFLKHTQDKDVKILWLADKLSNMRSFYQEYCKYGNEMWKALNQKDPNKQEWYYRTIASYLKELSDTLAYKEFVSLIDKVFKESK